jgi:hypothetical protein
VNEMIAAAAEGSAIDAEDDRAVGRRSSMRQRRKKESSLAARRRRRRHRHHRARWRSLDGEEGDGARPCSGTRSAEGKEDGVWVIVRRIDRDFRSSKCSEPPSNLSWCENLLAGWQLAIPKAESSIWLSRDIPLLTSIQYPVQLRLASSYPCRFSSVWTRQMPPSEVQEHVKATRRS